MTHAAEKLSDAEIARIAHRIDRPVALVGLMGVGKSTVGRKLAALLGKDFVDADEEIEAAAQMSVSDIFDRFGEPYFRDGERRVIARLIEDRRGVIATGGGAFVNGETRALLLDQAAVVWIDCDIDTLVERTTRRDVRPLLREGDPHEILSRLHREREPFYSQAHIRITGENGPHVDTAMAIIGALDRWL
ncbi:shikimate kinase [Pelagerythrobacter marinus]|uniref:Shikimate kinase n=1 Tax=Pelagerythrobacter marinus TaxID=538382 RepID=A0ABW9UU93_9SPHN|nr:shikimate kinase [Pelagerythrobacter marinus]MEC9066294.1 shikimate kinase [Pseudomonadota bacterium]MXO68155.1 shikimate kinase [Pelagerythrobacter marinus]USA40684.1 shikimate kinase [Pelagerythrobacter marinus]WPZ08145.1 shikimate kinase [Pelagerythrobacter marinus]